MPKDAGTIVVLTGAGISKESGLETFREEGGIWSRVALEDVATPDAFRRQPAFVHQFYNDRRRQLLTGDIQPNAAHEALVRLEREWPGEVLVVTQNIDDLHDRAGQHNLIHMHGEILKALCLHCRSVHPWQADMDTASACPSCGEAGGMRPNVVWFGEMPLELERIFAALDSCQYFLAIGTSGAVQPAAGFVQQARFGAGAHCVELNLEASEASDAFHDRRHGPATEVVPAYVAELLDG